MLDRELLGGAKRTLIDDAMRRALTLAHRSPTANSNPQVGCVILAPDGRIVSEGWHRGAGTPHAEVDALSHLPADWRDRGSELTAVVTLEPCNHTGHTGPCSVALVEAGIGAVAYALGDPNPKAGGGAETLHAACVEVQEGVLVDEARELLAPWLARQGSGSAEPDGTRVVSAETGRPGPRPTRHLAHEAEKSASPQALPHITIKWAQTIDGRAAAADGSSQWITGRLARADVHRRRAQADAILVGTGTLLADDPTLTARTPEGELLVPAAEQPLPVVLGHRAIPANARINRHPALAQVNQQSASTTPVESRPSAPLQFSGDDLPGHLAELHERGIRRLFVEGGPAVASSFIAAGLADDVLIYIAPALLGGPRLALGDLGITSIERIRRLRFTSVERLGDDLLLIAKAGDTAPESIHPTQHIVHTPELL